MLSKIKNSRYLNLIPEWLFILLFTFPALPLKITNIIFITFSGYVLLYWLLFKRIGLWKTLRKNLILTLPFIPYLIEFIMHSNVSIMQFEFQKKLLFFTAPVSVSIYLSVFNSANVRKCLNVFAASLSIISLYTIAQLIINKVLFNADNYENSSYLLRTSFENISHLHPTYFGLFAAIAVLWMVYDFGNYSSKWKYTSLFSITLLFFMIVLVAAKMPLFILAIGTIWIAYKKIRRKRNLLIFYSSLIIVSISLILFVPSLNSRVGEVSKYYSTENHYLNSMFQREVIYDCNIRIALANFWTGTGVRNAQFLLDNCYAFRSAGIIEANKFNSHNQFLTIMVNYGIVVLLSFVLCFVYLVKQTKDLPFGIIIISSFIFIMLTESILERQMGIYYYVLFSLLILNYRKPINSKL